MSSDAPAGIQAISRADVHRITSGQVVLDVQSAVKELVENALDAGARAIEVRFKEYGSESIEVVDNGSGIRQENYSSLALKHHTSKLSTFQDLTMVKTFGFRGEALSSLCELSNVQVVTATKEEEPVGTVLELNRDGTIKSQDKRVARQRGTTVTISELFVTLPVRRRELLKNVKREFAKAQTLLQAYAIISRDVRWVVSNSVKGRKYNIMTITGSSTPTFIRSNASAVFGAKACTSLIPLELRIPAPLSKTGGHHLKRRTAMGDEKDVEEDSNETEGEKKSILIQGLISRPTHGSGRSASDRIFLYLNGRPWDSSRIVRAFNEVYKAFNSNQYPMVIANFTIDGDKYDVNVSPDKRTLFLHDESEIIDGIKTALEEAFNPFQSTFTINGANLTAAKDAAMQSRLKFISKGTETQAVLVDSDEEEELSLDSRDLVQAEEDERDQQRTQPAKRQRLNSEGSLAIVDQLDSDLVTVEVPEEEEVVENSGQASDNDDDEDNTIVLDSTLASWSRQQTRENSREQSAEIAANQSLGRGRKASQATIEAKLTNMSPGKAKWSSQLRSFAATSAGSDHVVSEEEESLPDEAEDDSEGNNEVLEYREEGLNLKQNNEVYQQRQAYEKESMEGTSVLESEESLIEEEREANLSRLEEEAGQQAMSDERVGGWKSEIISHVQYLGDLTQIQIAMPELRERIVKRARSMLTLVPKERTDGQQFDQAGIEEKDTETVEVTLGRSIDKADFAAMNIIGQFNLGFVLVRRINAEEDDVFIVDQHAADEKYNFETLQRETKLKSQTLIRPRQLELPSSVEFVAAQHIQNLAAHGFLVKVNEEEIPGSRVELLALPISKNTTFGVADLEELLHKLAEVPPESERARSTRCSRLYDMLASRACRKSVMIGKALTRRQMNVILCHMGEIKQPWNCPHGRPTMRHLHRLDTYPCDDSSSITSSINWRSLL